MELISTETRSAPDAAPATSPYESCEQCGSPVEHNQRYCIVCGSRRKHAPDPAARFLSSAASRPRASTAGPSAPPRGGRSRRRAGIGTVVAIAAIPLAVALGVLVGRAGNGTDAKLLAALRAQKAEVVNIGGTAGASASVAGASAAHKRSSNTGKGAGKVLSTTKYGSFHSVGALKTPSSSQLSQNAQIVKRVQSQINSSYVNSQKNLPNQISVP